MNTSIDLTRMRRDVGGVATFPEMERADRTFWWSRTPEERFAYGEHLRQWNYHYDSATTRLSRSVAGVRRREGCNRCAACRTGAS